MKLPFDVQNRRVELSTDLLNDAFFLYCYLEISQRYGIKNYQVLKSNLDGAILDLKVPLMKKFRQHWTINHRWDIPGCRLCIVIDAGLKPHRKVCKALWNGVRTFEKACQTIVTGYTSYPLPHKTCCNIHDGESTPVPDSVSSDSRKKLKKYKNDHKASQNALDDDVYIIESILDITVNNANESIFKVKWFNFPVEAATYEPMENIPKFIIEYYKDDNDRLGKPLPNPIIKHSKKTSTGSMFYFLAWEGEKGGKWHGEDFFKLAGDQEASSLIPELSCQTRKSRDKRICR